MTENEKQALQDVRANVRRVLQGGIVKAECGVVIVKAQDDGVWLSREAATALLQSRVR